MPIRIRRGRADTHDAADPLKTRRKVAEERLGALGRVLTLGKRERDGDYVLRDEAGIGVVEPDEAADHQRRSDDEQHRDGDLHDHEALGHSPVPGGDTFAAPLGPLARRGGGPCRHEAERDRRESHQR